MTTRHTQSGAALLAAAYEPLLDTVGGLTDEQAWRPTRCTGWMAGDLIFHLLADAQRALVAFGSPAAAGAAAGTDAVGYWKEWHPARGPEEAELARQAERQLRNTRIMASVWSGIRPLADLYTETARAVLALAARLPGTEVVRTQGHLITVDDLLDTLAVEAAVHHLDLLAGLPEAPAPAPEGLAAVHRVLDGLLGHPPAVDWDDTAYALAGTGRVPLTDAERRALGPDADRFPLFG
ncbi:maleylpyruvate isomerase N-terminal domain-containing protein [Phaeacidiphilus oryzae]|uniref:maleylpyruvate isomerase N-terminal domain-containing protein n=1 Tax=Phaeacidiphilus oryzae TaxID=348818 RepID=UPI00055C83F9|nr:maleylpyruvate isomerase N-terminal domain-containing protein [Phaeacidiphilus oryzae]